MWHHEGLVWGHMGIDLKPLTIHSVIVHQLPKKGQASPSYSEVESDLDSKLRIYIKQKIVVSGGSTYAVAVEFNENTESPIPNVVTSYLGGNRSKFVERSRVVAEFLAQIQTRVNSAGLLAVVDIELEGNRGLCIMKLERESGLELVETMINGKRAIVLKHVGQLMLTESTKVFKAGIFLNGSAGITGVVSDNQRATAEVAQFFLSKFLGCQLIERPPVATKRFFEATEEFIKEKVKDVGRQVRYQIALSAEMQSPRTQLRPKRFAEDNLEVEDRALFLDFLIDRNADANTFKDTELVLSRIAGLQMSFASGTRLFAPSNAVEEGIVDVKGREGERTTVTINDLVEDMKGSGRGKRDPKPT